MRVSIAFSLIVDAFDARRNAPWKELPNPMFLRIDDNWSCWLNRKSEWARPGAEIEVPPFSALIRWKDELAGVIGPEGGTMIRIREATEDALIEALEKIVGKIEESPPEESNQLPLFNGFPA